MTSKKFLLWGGALLVLIGILGMMNVIGPSAEDSIFGSAWWFDNAENWAHLIIGIVALAAAFVLPMSAQRALVMLVGIIAVIVGVYGFFRADLSGAMLQNPADNILHIVVGVWAWMASRKAPGSQMATTM